MYYSELYLFFCPFKDLHPYEFKASKLHGKEDAATPQLINEENSGATETTPAWYPSRPSTGVGDIVIHDCMVHMIVDQFSISYSIITLVNWK